MEDRWRFGGGSGVHNFSQIVNYQNDTKRHRLFGGGWMYKTKKNSREEARHKKTAIQHTEEHRGVAPVHDTKAWNSVLLSMPD